MPFLATPAVMYGVMAASAALSAASAVNAGNQQKKAADYQAQEATQQGNNAADVAGANAISTDRSNRIQLGNAAAAQAQSGTGQTGTGMAALNQSAVTGKLNEMNIQYGGTQQAIALNNQAQLYQFQGQNAQTSGQLSAVGSLFSSAGSAYRYANNPAINSG